MKTFIYRSIIISLLLFVFNACENQIMIKLLDPLVVTVYKITFNANGGEGTIKPVEVNAGKKIKLPDGKVFSRRGFEFTSWSITGADGKTEYIAAGKNYTPTGNTTFYAEWTRIHVTVNVTDEDGLSLKDKLNWIKENADSDTTYMIILNDDETLDLSDGLSDLYYRNDNGGFFRNITIKISGKELPVILSSGGGPLFTVGKGVTLVLDSGVTLQGCDENNAALVYVDGGELVMKEGAKITGNNNVDGSGGGVYVTDGKFTMDGGEISENTARLGGGVYVVGGTFTMNGGEINSNTAKSGGGVYVEHNGTFIMNKEAKIIGNNADYQQTDDIDSGYGGGVNNHGVFTMNGGEISGGNTAQSGGGVDNFGTFTMIGGIINGNTAQSGGGVDNFGTFTMTGGTISGNTAQMGGGVDNHEDCTFKMSGAVIITNNTATGNGGGVLNGGTFIMSAGEISGNTAYNGGGVYVDSGNRYLDNDDVPVKGGEFTMSGGAIKSNTAYNLGGGVYVFDDVDDEQARGKFTGGTGVAGNTSGNDNGNDVYYNKDR